MVCFRDEKWGREGRKNVPPYTAPEPPRTSGVPGAHKLRGASVFCALASGAAALSYSIIGSGWCSGAPRIEGPASTWQRAYAMPTEPRDALRGEFFFPGPVPRQSGASDA
eukprot:CAMPEP_0118856124 /NCGR_PEP_ID=MMETSP1163-20130328/3721_1 /TAXON_ID=124430 /ORGANISM="Phaeomonas parva, Strain CCMP2877" /LENGTH=109 /DNA_ID=CAMNT_0006789169 /DNA_START=443 /DNA_END=773 /DNA_ORIENTATION=+